MRALLFLFSWLIYLPLYSQSSSPISVVEDLGAAFPPNTQFAIAIIQGETIQYYGYQKDDQQYKAINNQQAIFEIGSLTKVFTSQLLAQAIVDKKVKAHHPVQKYLPFTLHKRSKITLEQLANHTSGLPRLPDNIYPLLVEHPDNPYKYYDIALLQAYAKNDLKTYTNPGEQFAYSNLGAGLLGYALEHAYKSTYQQLVETLIFEPLNLKNSYVSIQKVPEDQLVEGLDATGKETSNWEWQVLAPAGCILSCVDDMGLFAKAHLKAQQPALQTQQTITFQSNMQMSLALGWLVLHKEGKDYYFHNGGTGGYTSSLLLDKSQQKAVVVLSNVSGMHSQRAVVDRLALELMKLE